MSSPELHLLVAEDDSEYTTDSQEDRKARGAFFTPEELTRFMVEWAIRSADDRVLEPSCGDAAFLLAAADRLRSLGQLFPELEGFDLHGPSVEQARVALAAKGVRPNLRVGDFFDAKATGDRDAVVGNPPYVRYQAFTGAARERGLEVAREHGVRLSQLANIWAAFVVHASQFLKPDGRLALVLPAVLLTVNYAAPVRQFLSRRFARVRLVMFRERVFPGVLEEVVLLLAEGKGPASALEVTRLVDAAALSGATAPSVQVAFDDSAKWTSALLGAETVNGYRSLLEEAGFEKLRDWGTVELGIVTGNNKYFTLSSEQVNSLGLPQKDLLRVSPSGSRHLRGLELSARYLETLNQEGRSTYLFYPADTPSDASRAYIAEGEARGVQQAYKCRVRSPWWRVPLVPVPDLIFTYMSGDAPRLVNNSARANILNSVHGVRLSDDRRDIGTELLPIAMLNSLTLLGAELVGRSYGGGILKVEPGEARRLPLPSADALEASADALRALKPQLGRHLRQSDLEGTVRKVDDALLVRQLGLSRATVREMREAWLDLKSRRAARGKKAP